MMDMREFQEKLEQLMELAAKQLLFPALIRSCIPLLTISIFLL